VRDDFNVDDLLKQWKYQDEFENIATGLLEAGIQLGVQSMGLMIAKHIIETNHPISTPEKLTELMDKSYDHAANELKRRLKNARGA
jgi:hypothetical protein